MMFLEAENLVREFDGLAATDDVNPVVEEDERVFTIGSNGAGKSTLISLITRWLGPTSGDIRFKGELTVGLKSRQVVQCGVSKPFQTASIPSGLTVRENAETAVLTAERGALGLEFLRYCDSLTDVYGVARDTLSSAGLLDRADTIATDLPYGDKRRLETGIALVSEPNLFFMDEPTAGMSPEETKSMVDLIEQVKYDHGLTFVLVEYDMEIVFSISDRIAVFSHGSITTESTPGETRGNEAV